MIRILAMVLATLIADYRDVTRESYDKTAVEYQENTEKLLPQKKAEKFLGYLGANSLILDLGCGPGRDAKYFVALGHRVIGADISPQMIALAKDAVPEGEFVVSDIESLEQEEKSLDGIWASASLLHVSKEAMPDVLAKLYRFLKPGGIFYVSMKKGAGEVLEPDERYGGCEKFWNYVDEEELVGLLEEAGFTVQETTTFDKSTSYQTHPWISVICSKGLLWQNHP